MTTVILAASDALSTFYSDFPGESPDAPWFTAAFEMLDDDIAFEWAEFWAEVERLHLAGVNPVYTTFTEHGTSHEAVGLDWSDVKEVLGRPHMGNSDDDTVLRVILLAEGAPAWVSDANGAIDGDGWYMLGPAVADPVSDDALETGDVRDFVVVDDESFAVDTVEQIDAVARMLHRLGLDEQPVYRGPAPDTIELSLRIIPRA